MFPIIFNFAKKQTTIYPQKFGMGSRKILEERYYCTY